MDASTAETDGINFHGGVTGSSPSEAAPQAAPLRPSGIDQPNLSPSPSAESCVTSVPDPSNAPAIVGWVATGRLCQLPLELRFKIYDFAYDEPMIDIIYLGDSKPAPVLAFRLPRALAATCHFLQDDLEDFVARRMTVHLRIDVNNTIRLEQSIPGCYRERVTWLEMLRSTMSNVKLQDLDNLVSLDTIIIKATMRKKFDDDEVEALFETTEDVQFEFADDCIDVIFENVEALHPLLQHCKSSGKRLVIAFTVGITEDYRPRGVFEADDLVIGIFEVEARFYGPDHYEIGMTFCNPTLFEIPKPYHEVRNFF